MPPQKTLLVVSIVAGIAVGGSGCGTAAGQRGGLQVVAAENVWGSLAAQVAGDRGQVASVITSPAPDPHDYEPTAAGARAFAGAKLVIVDGIGYDPWARKLLDANPGDGRGGLGGG